MYEPKAQQACSACRKHKRRCDRQMPRCGLCTRLERSCQYTDALPPPTAEDVAALWDRIADLEGRAAPVDHMLADAFPVQAQPIQPAVERVASAPKSEVAGIFLDWDAFTWLGNSVPRSNLEIPGEVLAYLPDSDSVQHMASQYFSTTHGWMPIISKKRMKLGYQLREGGADLALLFLSMKLISSPLPEAAVASANPLYMTSKRYLSLLETSGCISLIHLQGMFLVTLYEYCHGIYPAAWMGVAACVRYAEMLALPDYGNSRHLLGQSTTRTAVEEKRRIWWAIFVLDRVVCLGNKRRFLLPHPSAKETLPIDDAAWASIDSTLPPRLALTRTGRGLCQIAVFIGHALEHWTEANLARRQGHELDSTKLTFMVKTLNEARQVLTAEADPVSTPQPGVLVPYCLVESAIVLIQDFYSCPAGVKYSQECAPGSEEEAKIQLVAVQELRQVSLRLGDVARTVLDHTRSGGELALLNPMICDSIYCAGATMDWLYRESGDSEAEECLVVMKQFLASFGTRWRVGVEYLKVLDQHDIAVQLNISRS